jgi:uncharacterized protein YybS (DUF2232 family)
MESAGLAGASLIVILIFSIVAFIIGALITRWIFRIDRIVNALETLMALQVQAAKKAGVPDEDIKNLMTWTYGPGRDKRIKNIAG